MSPISSVLTSDGVDLTVLRAHDAVYWTLLYLTSRPRSMSISLHTELMMISVRTSQLCSSVSFYRPRSTRTVAAVMFR
jgi:hypothetical protein